MAGLTKGFQKAERPAAQDESIFYKIKPEESVDFLAITGEDGFISCYRHEHWDSDPKVFTTCTREKDCPGCMSGDKARFKAYVPVQLQDGEVVVMPFTITGANQFGDACTMLGKDNIKGAIFRMRRTGKGLNTRYAVISLGKRATVTAEAEQKAKELGEQLEDELGPFERAEIVDVYLKAGFSATLIGATPNSKPVGFAEVENDGDDDDGWVTV